MTELERIQALGFPDALAFQRHYRLIPDNIIGPQTRGALQVVEWYRDQLPRARWLEAAAEVPALASLMQAGVESAEGRSALARESNNLFGVKYRGVGAWREYRTNEWNPQTQRLEPVMAKFQVYSTIDACWEDRAALMRAARYRPAFTYKHDAWLWLAHIRRAGYATDPLYLETCLVRCAVWRVDELVGRPGDPARDARLRHLEEVVADVKRLVATA